MLKTAILEIKKQYPELETGILSCKNATQSWLFRRLRTTESDTQSHQIRVTEPCGIKYHSGVQSHILE